MQKKGSMDDLGRLYHFVRPYRKLAVFSLAMLLAMVFLDLAVPRLLELIIDQGIKKNNGTVVLVVSVVMLGFSVLSTIVAVLNSNSSVQVGESLGRDLREAIFVKIQTLSYGNLDKFSTGSLMVRLTSDTSAVQRLVQVSLRIGTRAPLSMIGSTILMFVTSPVLAFTMVPLLLITGAIIVYFSLKMEPFYRLVQEKLDRLNTVLQENISGARLVKASVRADHEAARFSVANEDLTKGTMSVMEFMSAMTPVLTVFINIGMVLIIWLGGLQSIEGGLSLGQIVAFSNYLLATMTPLVMMAQLSNTWANGLASAKRINQVLDAEPEILQDPKAGPLPEHKPSRVEFQDVDFHYQGSERMVLEKICLGAEPGQTIAILGATGSGKTSLVNLIPRFYDPARGTVLIDGIGVRGLTEDSLLEHIGIVPQETILFSGTIADNIRYGRPDATDEEVAAAAQTAQAHEFILGFPQGYQSRLEERGGNVSGGQKQRIAIARAILTRPTVLILDDSTSSVDVETETKIQAALPAFIGGCTCFVVAQRISTVLNADKIVVIDHGTIVAEGKHSDLLSSSPVYREIYDSQLGGGDAPPILTFAPVFSGAPASRGTIEKAKKPRQALTRLTLYLMPYKVALALVIGFVLLYSLLSLVAPYLTGVAIDQYIAGKDKTGLLWTAGIMLAVYVLSNLFQVFANWIMADVSQRALQDLRRDLFTHLQSLSMTFFDTNAAGGLMSRLTNDIDAINQAVSQNVTTLLASAVTMAGILVTMFVLNAWLAMASLIVVPIMLWFTRFVSQHTRKGFRDLQKNLGELNTVAEESISGQKVTKAFRRNATAAEAFRAKNQAVYQSGVQANSYALLLMPLTAVLGTFFVIVVAGLGGWLALEGLVTVGTIAAFINYGQNFTSPLRQVASLYNSIQAALAGAERVFEIIDTPAETADRPSAVEAGRFKGNVTFSHVQFGYLASNPVIKDFSLDVKAGQTIALVGPTGAGKTTIINLLTRFYEIQAGTITIDGTEIRDLRKADLRRNLGLVLQDTFLFADTVMENIRYGRLDATDDECRAAATLAEADAFILQLPQGYQTNLSERAGNLSQGQRQLLSITRAILANPAVLILDEATSSVDTRTEARIQKALLRLMEGRTSFVIAHRLSTIRDASLVVVINDGRIVEQGTHQELLDKKGFYDNLYLSQFKGHVI